MMSGSIPGFALSASAKQPNGGKLASYIANNGDCELAQIFFDTLGIKDMLKLMSPQFKTELCDRLVTDRLMYKSNPRHSPRSPFARNDQ
jgi:hypothetical protein